MQIYANCINTDNTLNYCWDIAHEQTDPALECKNSKRQPTYRRTQVSIVADMRFRGVASLNQVGTSLERGNRRSEVRRADSRGRSWRGAASLPQHQLGGLGRAVSSPPGFGAEPRPLKVFLAPPDCLSWHLSILLQLCVELIAMIAAHFHDTPYIHLGGGAPYVLGWQPLGLRADAPVRLCIYSPLFRIYGRTACFSVIP